MVSVELTVGSVDGNPLLNWGCQIRWNRGQIRAGGDADGENHNALGASK